MNREVGRLAATCLMTVAETWAAVATQSLEEPDEDPLAKS